MPGITETFLMSSMSMRTLTISPVFVLQFSSAVCKSLQILIVFIQKTISRPFEYGPSSKSGNADLRRFQYSFGDQLDVTLPPYVRNRITAGRVPVESELESEDDDRAPDVTTVILDKRQR